MPTETEFFIDVHKLNQILAVLGTLETPGSALVMLILSLVIVSRRTQGGLSPAALHAVLDEALQWDLDFEMIQ